MKLNNNLIRNISIPLLNIISALVVSSILFLFSKINPFEALGVLFKGAFGSLESISYTLFYSTNYMFMALGFMFASKAGVFNIGCEGQGYLGGLGMTIVFINLGFLPPIIIIPLGLLGAMVLGGGLALFAGYLQAYRKSNAVITTIMFNIIVSAIMIFILNKIKDGASLETAYFHKNTFIPNLNKIFPFLPNTPLNISFVIAIVMCVVSYYFLKYTPIGYEIKVLGMNPKAARYAGISDKKIMLIAMLISGSLASFTTLNEIAGVYHRLIQDFVLGAGFAGIAVALMGRNHPFGIMIAAILFGAFFQGGGELAFEYDKIDRDFVVIIQGLIILFAGALEHMYEELFFNKKVKKVT